MNKKEQKKSVIKDEEKDLVISFIQFLRQKVASGECDDGTSVTYFLVYRLHFRLRLRRWRRLRRRWRRLRRRRRVTLDGTKKWLDVGVKCLENGFSLENYATIETQPLLEIWVGRNKTPKVNDIERANCLKAEGDEFFKNRNFEKAIEKYTEALKFNEDLDYYTDRAAAYNSLKKYDEAIKDCRYVTETDKTCARAHYRLGYALYSLGGYRNAVEAFSNAVKFAPKEENYKVNLNMAKQKLKAEEADQLKADEAMEKKIRESRKHDF